MTSGRLERELHGHSDAVTKAVADQLFMNGPPGAGGVAATRPGMSSNTSRFTLIHNRLASGTVRSPEAWLLRLVSSNRWIAGVGP